MRKQRGRHGAASGRAHKTGPDFLPGELRRRIETYRENLSHEFTQHPGRTVAAALGAGYLVGGGLLSRFTARLVGIGIRLGLHAALVPYVTQGVVALRQEALSRADARHRKEEPTTVPIKRLAHV